jgi:hypothetical protein
VALGLLNHNDLNLAVMRKFVFILMLVATALISHAEGTNYYCIVCGKGPLSGHIWLYPRGPVCDDCYKLPDRCSICGLPVKDGDGHIKTGDGRFICKFDAPNAVMTQDQARDLFEQTRDEVVDLYGPQFALKNTEVTVNMFDVDYWSEKGRENGLHTYGFASSRPAGNGAWTHEVVMLSGRTHDEMMAVAAHEYTHLWLNENRPPGHHIDGDTVEAICELTAYKLMQKKNLPERQKKILENPYTNGKIKDLVEVEREGGTDYVLNWVKNSTAETFDVDANLAPLTPPSAPMPATAAPYIPAPRPQPNGLKFSGIMSFGKAQMAIINGESFAVGDQKMMKLHDRSVTVHCLQIGSENVTIEANGKSLTLKRDEETSLP